VVLFLLSWVYFLGACTRLDVYTIIIAGWSSNSVYSLLGGLRALAQTISYEVTLTFVLLSFVVRFVDIIWFTFILFGFIYGQFFFLFLCHLFDLLLVWLRLNRLLLILLRVSLNLFLGLMLNMVVGDLL
jgi:NADH-ubiquinone oxidoreductase chain 1